MSEATAAQGAGTGAAVRANGAGTAAPIIDTAKAQADTQARLAREQARVKERQEAKRAVETARAELAKVRAEADTNKALIEKAKTDPSALYGPDFYNQWTQRKLSGSMTPEEVEARIREQAAETEKRITAKAAEDRAALEHQQAEQKAQAEQEWEAEVTETLKADTSGKYKLINMHGAHNLVTQYVKANYQKTGKLASEHEAGAQIEAQLRKAVFDSVDDAMYADLQKARQTQVATKAIPQQRSPTALHSGITSGADTTHRKSLSREEREANAIRRLEEAEARAKATQ